MVTTAGDYQWSSFRVYGYGQKNALITENILYQTLGNNQRSRQEAYRNYVEPARAYEALVDKYFKERVLV